MRGGERGFTLVEVLIGAAVGALVIFGLLVLAGRMAAAAGMLADRGAAQARAARLSERLESEADGAWAIFVPARDVLGNANADGHELDFFAEDASHRPYAWAYRFDAATHLLTRYAYAPGVAAVATETVGTFDAFAASGPFDVRALADPASAAYDPLFATATVTPVAHRFDALPAAVGGNGLVRLAVRAPGVEQSELLASATAPTSFTVLVTYTPSPAPTPTAPLPLPTLTSTP